MKTTNIVVVGVIISAIAGCGMEYIPRTVYEIETKDGRTLKLLCPVIDLNRSTSTYLVDGDCIAVKEGV